MARVVVARLSPIRQSHHMDAQERPGHVILGRFGSSGAETTRTVRVSVMVKPWILPRADRL
jgi:hypothetical protein